MLIDSQKILKNDFLGRKTSKKNIFPEYFNLMFRTLHILILEIWNYIHVKDILHSTNKKGTCKSESHLPKELFYLLQ